MVWVCEQMEDEMILRTTLEVLYVEKGLVKDRGKLEWQNSEECLEEGSRGKSKCKIKYVSY